MVPRGLKGVVNWAPMLLRGFRVLAGRWQKLQSGWVLLRLRYIGVNATAPEFFESQEQIRRVFPGDLYELGTVWTLHPQLPNWIHELQLNKRDEMQLRNRSDASDS